MLSAQLIISRLSQLDELLKTYYPIEIDSSLSVEEKLPLMVEWWVFITDIYRQTLRVVPVLPIFSPVLVNVFRWTKAHDLLVEQRIRKDQLAEAVRESEARLRSELLLVFVLNYCERSEMLKLFWCWNRDGYELFFDHLHQHGVPLLIFSAGIGDILEEVIRHFNVYHSNVKIFSNYMDFDESVSRHAPRVPTSCQNQGFKP